MSLINEVLSGNRGLAGIRQLLSAESVNQALLEMVDEPNAIVECQVHRAKYKPNRKLTGYYNLHLRQPWGTGSCARSVCVTWTPEGGQQSEREIEADAMQAEIAHRGMAAPFKELSRTMDDGAVQIQVAPLDPTFPQLERLYDPLYVSDLLAAYAPSDPTAASKRQGMPTVEPIRYRPRQRHVLRYESAARASSDGEPSVLFAKLYRDGDQGQFCAQTHQLADWLESSTPDAGILRPLDYLPGDRTILYGEAKGTPLSAGLGGPIVELANHLRQAGTALRVLHNTPRELTHGLPSLEIEAELRAIRRTCEHIVVLLPAQGETISALLHRAEERYAGLPQEAPTFVHGDFKADHVLAEDGQLTLFDFDSCALGDPAYDIGKFLADLGWWYAEHEQAALQQARAAFLAGYGLASDHPRLQRAQIWEMLIGIKITSHRIRIFDENWSARTIAAIEQLGLEPQAATE